MTIRKLKPRPRRPAPAAYPGLTQLRLIEAHWQDATADLQLLRYNYELIAGQFTRLQQHVGKLVEHCERLMREKEALLRAQRAEDETPHRLEMLEDDMGAVQRQIGRLNTEPKKDVGEFVVTHKAGATPGTVTWHATTCAVLRGGACTCGVNTPRQAG